MKTGSKTLQFALFDHDPAATLPHLLVANDGTDVPYRDHRLAGRAPPSVLAPKAQYSYYFQQLGLVLALTLHDSHVKAQSEWRTFMMQLNESERSARSVLISSEVLAFRQVRPSQLLAALQPAYDVSVVLVYRRFFEWIVSLNYQGASNANTAARSEGPIPLAERDVSPLGHRCGQHRC